MGDLVLKVSGCFLAAYGGLWRFSLVSCRLPGGSWQLLAASGGFWRPLGNVQFIEFIMIFKIFP